MHLNLLFSLASLLTMHPPATPVPERHPSTLIVGKLLPYWGAIPVSGPQYERDTRKDDWFKPAFPGNLKAGYNYQISRGAYPLFAPKPKLVLFTGILNEPVLSLMRDMEGYLSRHPELDGSLVQVGNDKLLWETPINQVLQTRDELISLSQKLGLQKLSLAISYNKRSPDFLELLYAHPGRARGVGGNEEQNVRVVWVKTIPVKAISPEVITSLLKELDTVLSAPKHSEIKQ